MDGVLTIPAQADVNIIATQILLNINKFRTVWLAFSLINVSCSWQV
jgi:hypothetical protein